MKKSRAFLGLMQRSTPEQGPPLRAASASASLRHATAADHEPTQGEVMSEAAHRLLMTDLDDRATLEEPRGRAHSLPIPVRDGPGVEVCFFYYEMRTDGAHGLLFWKPERLRRFSLTGELLAIRELPSPFWRADLDDDSMISPPRRARLCTPAECRAARACLLCDLDALVPAFEAGVQADPAVATRAIRQLRLVAEANLRALHEQIGHEFFAWLLASAPGDAWTQK